MADTVTITEQDRIDAENILEQFLTDQMPDVDFSKGSAMRDFAVVALANIFAYLRAEKDLLRARQSLLLLGKLSGTDVDDAVDEILSNWFISRKQGRKASGTATIYFSEKTDVEVPTSAKFYKTSALAFELDALDNMYFSEDDMLPVIDSEGVVVAYTIEVPLKATRTGEAYNIDTGAFADFTRFNPFITRVENNAKFSGGGGTETTDEMLQRAETAITVRDLNSARSIDATLKDAFEEIDDVVVIGYGEPEMLRDLVIEDATNTRIHAGGFVDAYIRSPIVESRTFEGEVGGEFTDPREEYYVFRDPSIVNSASGSIPDTDFETYGIKPGDILKIHSAIESYEPDMYIIKKVSPYGLQVSRRSPFPKAMPLVEGSFTDGDIRNDGGLNKVKSAGSPAEHTFVDAGVEDGGDIGKYIRIVSSANPRENLGTGKIVSVDTANNEVVVTGFSYDFVTETDVEWELITRPVSYTIGTNSPDYNDKISAGPYGTSGNPSGAFTGDPRHSGVFTKTIQNDGRVLLPGRPIYRITDVSMPGADFPSGLVDTDGRLRFPNRINEEPQKQTTAGDLQYQVVSQNPEESQSGWQILEVDVGWKSTTGEPNNKKYFNGKTLRVTYDTITAYDSVWAFMVSTDRRIICGSVIPKGLHPVYLTLDIHYRLSKRATTTLDTEAAKEALVDFINNFDVNEDIDLSAIMNFLRDSYPEIGRLEPTPIFYQLLAPDGRVIYYKTDDAVSVEAAYIINPNTGTAPDPAKPEDKKYILEEPLSLGVSDNTVRYLTAKDLITFTEV